MGIWPILQLENFTDAGLESFPEFGVSLALGIWYDR